MSERQNRYVDLRINGRLFPSWVLKNYSKYKLPEIFREGGEDPCKEVEAGAKLELRKYQEFLVKYMDYRSPYRDILMYFSVGAGKTGTAIAIYNMLYNYHPAWNVFILLKATLRASTWIPALEDWLARDESEFRMKNIIFISYDSPIADRAFLDAIKNADSSKKSLYIIDEAHNFIRNVYTNINSRQGRRAQVIYDYIINDKRENEGVRVILMSGTPAINTPYELALMFNLLRPGIFPKSEATFNQIYVSTAGYQKLNDASKNMFERRIMGLVAYYIGATPDLYATKTIHYVDVVMSAYQAEIYTHFEEIEEAQARQARSRQGGSQTYKTYTRQAANFVFPNISQRITGESRPRPSKFRIDEKDAELVDEGKGKLKLEKGSVKAVNVLNYLKELNNYVNTFDEFLGKKQGDDEKAGYTILDDVRVWREKYKGNWEEFNRGEEKKSSLYGLMYMCSAKMLAIIFNVLKSPGSALVYSNYVLVEGLQIFKVYLKYFGYERFVDRGHGVDGFRYVEYHGGIDEKERFANLKAFNNPENKDGKLIKIIMISPAGAEGINLRNVRQVHLMEPYWHEVRMTQMTGRAIRQCSHKDLPIEERHVDIYRYKSIRKNSAKWTTDQFIEDLARGKEGLIQSFLDAMKEVAVDCVLNKSHNMMAQEYKCFQFDEPSLFENQIGPAYKEDVYDDMKVNNGSNDLNSVTVKIKVMRILAVIQTSMEDANGEAKYSEPKTYWYSQEYGTVYDEELYYAVGKVATDDDNIPKRLDRDTYIIDKLVPIPQIE
ncbi:MAG: DEAD/SNF2-like helicase [Hyperionvirus sp.]|uniref:DEAD/SNF2-like helicase n=1 Tax=Hyperionvirus sp. TaxID=2487770 RepID=A0A3G5AAV9_9VIRU|nr:MAG: DEAD/SNF2-like helicase [Hyperionvirus sp.]